MLSIFVESAVCHLAGSNDWLEPLCSIAMIDIVISKNGRTVMAIEDIVTS